MGRLTLQVAGESHGSGLTGILTGLPRGVPFSAGLAAHWLKLRREVGGRGPRMKLEAEQFRITAGVTDGSTTGGPVAFFIPNADSSGRSVTPEGEVQRGEFPRPGHGDLAGALKWNLTDVTPVVEMASARITAAYTLAGAICQMLLHELGISSLAHVVEVGSVKTRRRKWRRGVKLTRHVEKAESSPLLCLSPASEELMLDAIAGAAEAGDTLGGLFEIVVAPVRPGLGAPQPLSRRLDGRLAGLIMSVPGVKAAASGRGFDAHRITGRKLHDEILPGPVGEGVRSSNNAGGIEGGMSNGEPLVLRAIVKPIASLKDPLPSVSLLDGSAGTGARVRGDVCVAAPAAIVARALTAYALADEVLLSCGGDLVDEVVARYRG